MKSIVIYQPVVDAVNGTNTSIINFMKTFCNDYDINVVCDSGNIDVILEFSKYANVYMKFKEVIECDYLILNRYDVLPSTLLKIKSKTKPKQIIHCDFDYLNSQGKDYIKLPIMDVDYVCVSDIAKKGLEKVFKKKGIVIPNIVVKPIQRKWLRLCSATRCDESKGYPEMCKFARLLKKHGIDYIWDVYTNSQIFDEEGLFNVKKPLVNVDEYYCNYDYVVIFSRNDTFSFNIHTSLISGVPVLVTPFEAINGVVEDGKNGYILPYDMELNKTLINKIVKKIPKDFEYKELGGVELWKKMLK